MELHPFWRQDELVKFCQLKGIHVSAHTPLGVPTISPNLSDSGSGEDEPGTPRISFRRSRSVHGPMLKLSLVADIAERHKKTPEQVHKFRILYIWKTFSIILCCSFESLFGCFQSYFLCALLDVFQIVSATGDVSVFIFR